MTLPSDSQIKSFLLNEVRPLNPRKFVILVSRKGADAGYAGFHYLNAKYGYFHYNSMTSNILAAHELGHGFGLQQFVKNLNLLIIFHFLVHFIEQLLHFQVVPVQKMITHQMILEVIIVQIHQVVLKLHQEQLIFQLHL